MPEMYKKIFPLGVLHQKAYLLTEYLVLTKLYLYSEAENQNI